MRSKETNHVGKKNFKFITTVCIFVLLTMSTTAAKLDTNLKAETVTSNAKTNHIESYNYEQGVYCIRKTEDGVSYIEAGIPLPESTSKSSNQLINTERIYKRCCVFVNKFQADEDHLFGQFEDDDVWYALSIIWQTEVFPLMVRVETEQALQVPKAFDETVFKNSFRRAKIREKKNKEYENLLTQPNEDQFKNLQTQLNEKEDQCKNLYTQLNEKEDQCKNLYTQLNENENTSKYYGYAVIILVILVLVLILMLISTSTLSDSNTNRKFNVGDRVKVRNTKKQAWRTGVVKQALKVKVDGWQKAHTWHYVQHIVPVSENSKSHGKKTPKSNSKKQLVTATSSSKAEKDMSDDKTASNSINEVTEDNTVTQSEDNTENQETTSVNTITNTHSNSDHTTIDTNSS